MNKKSVVITGAGTGIGAACAQLFSEKNYHVILLGRRLEKLKEVAQTLPSSDIYACDITNTQQVEKVCQELIKKSPYPINCLVNNAGIFERLNFKDTTDQHWQEQFDTNVFGVMKMSRALWPYFEKQGHGSIVNVSSTLGLKPRAQVGAYSATKAAVIAMTQAMALEGGEKQIRVNCVCPGLVDTPIHSFHDLPTDEKQKSIDNLKNMQPLGRIGTPREVADAVYFIGSNHSAWTTGAILSVDGGVNLT